MKNKVDTNIKKENTFKVILNKIRESKKLKKFNDFIEKYHMLFFVGILMLNAIICIFSIEMIVDYIWNYANIIKLCRGEVIYRDVNIIISPLFFDVSKIILNVFGQKYYIYRIMQYIFGSCLLFATYKLLIQLKMKKRDALLIVLLFIRKFEFLFILGVYVPLSYLFAVIGLIYVLKRENSEISDIKFYIIEAIMAVLVFLTYQKMGAAFALFFVLYELVVHNKKGFIDLVKIGMLSLIGVGIFIITLLIRNVLPDFINIALLGMGSFKENFKLALYYSTIGFYAFIIMMILFVVGYLCKKKKFKKEEYKKEIVLFFFSIGMLLISVPIINTYHFALFEYSFIIFGLYCINNIIKLFIEDNESGDRIFQNIMCILFIILSIYVVFLISINLIGDNKSKYDKELNNKIEENSQVYEGIRLCKLDCKRILALSEYIKEKRNENDKYEYLIVSDISNAISLYDGVSHGFFDMPLKGNTGKNGEEKLLEELKNKPNTYFIVAKEDIEEKDNNINIFQFVSELEEYVKNNYEKVDEIEEFEIYYGKKESIANEN